MFYDITLFEFFYATLPANANHLVASIKRMLQHVLPEFPGYTYNANLLHIPSIFEVAHNATLTGRKKR